MGKKSQSSGWTCGTPALQSGRVKIRVPRREMSLVPPIEDSAEKKQEFLETPYFLRDEYINRVTLLERLRRWMGKNNGT